MEIERKYLINRIPEELNIVRTRDIEIGRAHV